MDKYDWLETAKQLDAIAQAGLTYSESDYDRDRYRQIRAVAHKILNHYTGISFEKLPDLFSNEFGYQTPKVDVRGVILKKNKVLLVKEKIDGRWSLPGGWTDIGLSPKTVVEKEVLEEAGLKVSAKKLLAIFDKLCHDHPPDPYHSYKLFFLCEHVSGEPKPGMETHEVAYYGKEELPPLSIERNTEKQIRTMFELAANPDMPTVFD